MPLITRQEKGSKLTIAEMDGNLEYLASSSFHDGEYSQTSPSSGGEIVNFTTADGGRYLDIGITPARIPNAIAGTYIVSPAGGSGVGAEFELIVKDEGAWRVISLQPQPPSSPSASSIINGGTGYFKDDELTISTNDIGGDPNSASVITFTLKENSVTEYVESKTSAISVTPTITSIISADGDITQNGSVIGISDLDPFTISNGATGSYVISEPDTSGNGSGLEIELLIYGTSGISMSIDLTGFAVIEGGNGYAVGDELYIYASQIGGTGEEDFITITLGEGDVNIIPYGALAVSPKQTLLTAGNSVVINLNSQKGISLTSDGGNSTDVTIGSEGIRLNAPTLQLAGELDTTQLILPTTDPGSLGQLWVDTENGFVLKVSTGS